jgi:hypothetical protein
MFAEVWVQFHDRWHQYFCESAEEVMAKVAENFSAVQVKIVFLGR